MKISDLLEALDRAMGVIKTVAETPGVNMIPYASTLSSVIGAAHAAYEAGKDIKPFVDAIKNTFTGDGIPTQSDLDALDTEIADLEMQVDRPLPLKEDGEPG